MTKVDDAVALRKLGWNVVAAAPRGKTPIGSWRRYQTERVPERTLREAFSHGDPNLFVITGVVSRLAVLDCDDDVAMKYWTDRLGGDVLDGTTQVKTGNGSHFYFRLAEGQIERGRSSPGGDSGKWDLRCEGGGVVAPPSVHPSGRLYAWVDERGPGALKDAPAELFDRGAEGDAGDTPRSMLSHLLSNVPAEGGRNMWLSRIAGHYALHIPHEDAYEHLVRDAAARLEPPLPEEEIRKTIKSIWQTEEAKKGKIAEPVKEDEAWRVKLAEPSVETGYLVSGGTRILVQTRRRNADGQWELGLAMWMDADIRVLGVTGGEADRTYEVEIRRPNGLVIVDALPAAAVSSPQRLPAWLARHGASIGVPDEMWPVKMREGSRLVRYLEAQEAPTLEAIPYLGWHDESSAFVTHEGIIRADGRADFEAVRPHPAMKNWAKYRYGVEAGVDGARDVLRRVLEFHDETVASVFGAWWAASLLKPQIQRLVSQFPFMALEAASESGKTTGYFNLMMQLGGHFGGQSNPTVAALRDALSANRSGIVWVDDLDDLEHHGELLRNVTVGGSLVKKGEDSTTQVTAQMRAALVISGEGLGLHGQKALLDRAILLNVPSPVGRLNRENRPQWDDILELGRSHPDLTALAGNIVQMALQQDYRLQELKKLRIGSGRFADKNAIIRVGARVLAGMTEENWMVELADDWALSQQDSGSENALTLTVIPEVLALTGYKSRPEGPDESRRLTATPAFVDKDLVWFSPMLLEQWLQRNRRRASTRLETRQALEDQARALGLGGVRGVDRKQFRFETGGGKAVYWRCDAELSASLMWRSQGISDQDGEESDVDNQDSLI